MGIIGTLGAVCLPLAGGADILAIVGGSNTQDCSIGVLLGGGCNVNGNSAGETRGVDIVATTEVSLLGGEDSGIVSRSDLEGVVLSDHRPNKIAHFY